MKKWCLAASLACSLLSADEWVSEQLYSDWRQSFKIDKVLFEEHTDFQDLIIFENSMWGKVLALDGVIQTTEQDEFVYHEMMGHVPLVSHGKAEQVLVVGGGDGGLLRELLKHKEIRKIVLVEIDPEVIRFSKEHLSFISQGSLDDPRVEIVIQDGMDYVKNTDRTFDVIFCDSTDPIGPGAVLFTDAFYQGCKEALNEGGIFVNHAGVPATQRDELPMVYGKLKKQFKEVSFYLGVIPTYVGGYMAFGFSTDSPAYHQLSDQEIQERVERIEGKMKYYNAKIHKASFSLPTFISEALYEEESILP